MNAAITKDTRCIQCITLPAHGLAQNMLSAPMASLITKAQWYRAGSESVVRLRLRVLCGQARLCNKTLICPRVRLLQHCHNRGHSVRWTLIQSPMNGHCSSSHYDMDHGDSLLISCNGAICQILTLLPWPSDRRCWSLKSQPDVLVFGKIKN